jgi:WhiB family redox-sensing transcriptional regulator
MPQPTDQTWRDEALCQQTDPDVFFPEKGYTSRAAKKVCGRCPVRTACLADAISTTEPHGIRGGMTPRERLTFAQVEEQSRRSAKRWAA